MSVTCPYCDGTGRAPENGVHTVHTDENLREDCRERGITLGISGTISEPDLARLLSLSTKRVQNRRYAGGWIRHRRINTRVRYTLADIADYLNGITANEI